MGWLLFLPFHDNSGHCDATESEINELRLNASKRVCTVISDHEESIDYKT